MAAANAETQDPKIKNDIKMAFQTAHREGQLFAKTGGDGLARAGKAICDAPYALLMLVLMLVNRVVELGGENAELKRKNAFLTTKVENMEAAAARHVVIDLTEARKKVTAEAQELERQKTALRESNEKMRTEVRIHEDKIGIMEAKLGELVEACRKEEKTKELYVRQAKEQWDLYMDYLLKNGAEERKIADARTALIKEKCATKELETLLKIFKHGKCTQRYGSEGFCNIPTPHFVVCKNQMGKHVIAFRCKKHTACDEPKCNARKGHKISSWEDFAREKLDADIMPYFTAFMNAVGHAKVDRDDGAAGAGSASP